jgi:hypothetical protein
VQLSNNACERTYLQSYIEHKALEILALINVTTGRKLEKCVLFFLRPLAVYHRIEMLTLAQTVYWNLSNQEILGETKG